MPQLMPLYWIFSFSIMIWLLMVMINMYYYSFDSIDCLMNLEDDYYKNYKW